MIGFSVRTAIVMPASSLSVVIAAWRGRTFPESFA